MADTAYIEALFFYTIAFSDDSRRAADESRRAVDDPREAADGSRRAVDDPREAADNSRRAVNDPREAVDDSLKAKTGRLSSPEYMYMSYSK